MTQRFILRHSVLIILSLLPYSTPFPTKAISKDVVEVAELFLIEIATIVKDHFLEPLKYVSNDEIQIINGLKALYTDLQNTKDMILNKLTNTISDKLTEKVDKLFEELRKVERTYNKFLVILKNRSKYNDQELEEFANMGTSIQLDGLIDTFSKMHSHLIDSDFKKESIISLIARKHLAFDTMCINGQSPQQLINDLSEMVVTSHMKGLTIVTFCYLLKEYLEKEDYTNRKEEQLNYFKTRVRETSQLVKEVMSFASREIWNCDPNQYINGVTYSHLGPIWQGYIVDQEDLGLLTIGKPCEQTTYAMAACNQPTCTRQPQDRRCMGLMRDCQYIAKKMQLCHAPAKSLRRYYWMVGDDDKTVYGHKDGECRITQNINRKYFYDLCLCRCESSLPSEDRYFSLQDVVSDVNDNKVITGVRLKKIDFAFYIQIQQGTLGVNASIIDTPEWKSIKELPEMKLSDSTKILFDYVYSNSGYDRFVANFGKNKLVYAVTYDQRNVHLHDFQTGPNNLLTGIRFQHTDSYLSLQVQTTQFDYASGKLRNSPEEWLKYDDNKYRNEVILTAPDDPIRMPKSDTFSDNNTFIRFKMSNIERDLGQNIVPFIDIREVVSNPPMPLSGAGIFHRGKQYFGGLLALKLIHYDLTTNWS